MIFYVVVVLNFVFVYFFFWTLKVLSFLQITGLVKHKQLKEWGQWLVRRQWSNLKIAQFPSQWYFKKPFNLSFYFNGVESAIVLLYVGEDWSYFLNWIIVFVYLKVLLELYAFTVSSIFVILGVLCYPQVLWNSWGGKNTDKEYVTVACLFICSFGLIGNSNVL